MASKLRIKIGDVEVDFEGSEDFLKAEVPVLLEAAMELAKAAPVPVRRADDQNSRPPADDRNMSGTTKTIAAKLGGDTGLKVLAAAAAHLTLVGKKETFTRDELLEQMKSASGYYKASYSKNLTRIIGAAIKDDIITENAANIFALKADKRKELGDALADG